MIKIYCDICGKEPDDRDFACDLTKVEIVTSLTGESFVPMESRKKDVFQICKGCFYVHISKLLKNEKENPNQEKE